jgi:hypothetical protein
MPTFQRNMLSHLQGLEWQGREVEGFFVGPEEQGLRAGSQSEGGNIETGCGPIGSFQEGYRDGAGCGVRKKREKEPFSGLTRGRRVLVRGQFMFP